MNARILRAISAIGRAIGEIIGTGRCAGRCEFGGGENERR